MSTLSRPLRRHQALEGLFHPASIAVIGAYVASLDDGARGRLERHLRSAYLTGRPDGERSFVAVALSCRGVVPNV